MPQILPIPVPVADDAAETSLDSIDSKTPALGQALAAASVPVVLPADQIAALEPLSSVAVNNFPATQPVSAASLPLPTGAATEATLSALSGKVTACNTGAVTISSALPAGTNVIGGIAGDVAAGAADSGNPVKVGGVVHTTSPAPLTEGQRAACWLNPLGAQAVAIGSVGYFADGIANASGVNVSNGTGNNNPLGVGSGLFNNSTWERQRSNYESTIFSSAARTASQNSSDQTNYNARGVVVVLNVSAVGAGGGNITVKVQGMDKLSGQYYDILTSAAISGVSVNKIVVYPGLATTPNLEANHPLPRVWRVVVTSSDGTTSFTYSVAANYIL